MKNRIYLFVVVLLMCFLTPLVGCSDVDHTDDINAWILNTISTNVADDIELPTTCPQYKNSSIYWVSEDEWTLDNTGKIVDRPKSTSGAKVPFTYTIVSGNYTKDYEIVFKVSAKSLSECEESFLRQFPHPAIVGNLYIDSQYSNGIVSVEWSVDHPEIIDEYGVLSKPYKDTNVIFTYKISDGNNTIENQYEALVSGMNASEFSYAIKQWVLDNIFKDTYITEDLNLPTEFLDTGVPIIWTSTDEAAISTTGKVTRTIYDRYVNIGCGVDINGYKESSYIACKVPAKDISGMTKQEIVEEFINNIATNDVSKTQYRLYNGIYQSYGFINFYNSAETDVHEMYIIPGTTNGRPMTKRKVEYVCVHDTANNSSGATAKANGEFVFSGYGGESTCWQYTVGEDGVYIHIPEDEVSWHAGDSSRKFELIDTGIKATSIRPNVTLSDDGYYVIGGEKTSLRPYSNTAGTTFDTENYKTSQMNSLGVLVEIGENGNYFMGKTYYNSGYAKIANFGGNWNSVGIESAVNQGSDYATTTRYLAKLVAEICIRNELSVDRVKGHHYFSGKPCPNALLTDNRWYNFLTMVSMEKFAKENLSDFTFEWTSKSPNMDDTGRISLNVHSGDILNYSVKVINNDTKGVFFSHDYSTQVK